MNEFSPQNNSLSNGLDSNSSQHSQHNSKDIQFSYFSERVKKITTAVYIVTNLMPESDPLRQAIRRLSVRLLSLIGTSVGASFGVSNVSQTPAGVSAEISESCKKICSMLEIAYFSGYISEMNFSVLKGEIDIFENEIAGYQNTDNLIDKDLFKTQIENIENAVPSPLSLKLSAENPKGQKAFFNPRTPAQIAQNKKRILTKKTAARDQSKSGKGIVETKKTSRKESIISIIKMKGSVGIKDISSVIINCSEKTIQRELTNLVVEGVLKKTGDRRWSTYSLVS